MFGGGQGPAGLGRFLDEQLAGLGGSKQAGFNLGPVEDTAGDQAVEADPGLVQGVVAAASGGVDHDQPAMGLEVTIKAS